MFNQLVSRFFDDTAKSYDSIVAWATLGRDDYWKKKILDCILNGGSFLDLGCGTGILTRKIAQRFRASKIIGIDITASYLEVAKKNSSLYKNIKFYQQDAEKPELDSKFDYVVSSYVPKYCEPKILIKNSLEILNQGGKIILHDFAYPKNRIVQALWSFYFVILSVAGNLIPNWKYAFSELPKLIRSSEWIKEYEKEMILRGLDVKTHYLTCSCAAILVGARKNT